MDEVFIAQGAESFGAVNSKQLYVSVSRAREKVNIYTDDKAALLSCASELGDRRSALELVNKPKHSDFVHHLEKGNKEMLQIGKELERQKPITKTYISREDYEPTL